jgi:hypothetical protein
MAPRPYARARHECSRRPAHVLLHLPRSHRGAPLALTQVTDLPVERSFGFAVAAERSFAVRGREHIWSVVWPLADLSKGFGGERHRMIKLAFHPGRGNRPDGAPKAVAGNFHDLRPSRLGRPVATYGAKEQAALTTGLVPKLAPPARHHNHPPPDLRIGDEEYLREIRNLIAELRTLNSRLATTRRQPKKASGAVVKPARHFNNLFGLLCEVVGKGGWMAHDRSDR